MKKLIVLVFLSFLFFSSAWAQSGKYEGTRSAGNKGRLYGKVIDAGTNKGIDAASVQLYTVHGKDTAGVTAGQPANGMLTRPNGDFSLGNLSVNDNYLLVISAIGYQKISLPVNFKDEPGNSQKDMGNISIQPASQYLNSVTVVARKPVLQMGIDRKVFDVEKSITSSGGTAIDVMRNIPSVSVDADGNIELRNSTPTIYVDGRPTILTLDQIPADAIEKVELITNPSAKFDASSSGGIINVVLKKNKRLGFNGLAALGLGSPKVLNGNLNLSLRQGKFNFYTAGHYNTSQGTAAGGTYRINKENGQPQNYFNQSSENDRLRRFYAARFGVDYFMDNRNTLSISQHFVRGHFNNDETQNQEYLDINKAPDHYGDRLSQDKAQFKRNSTRLSYTHNFPKEGKQLSADINYNYGGHQSHTDILNDYYNPDGSLYADRNLVHDDGDSHSKQATFQLDFVDPNGENSKWEAGARSYINNYTSLFDAFSVDSLGDKTKLPLSNHYEYQEMVNAMYVTYSNKWKGIGYQVGLRAEYSRFSGKLIDSASKFGYEYPNTWDNLFDGLFPSVFLTKELSEGEEIQLNYTRRINRPDFWDLNPFIDINDPQNLRQGNPALKPEFINSFEFNYGKTYSSGNFLGVLYWRNNPQDITQYSDTITAAQYAQLNNAAVDPNAILNTYINANVTNRYGAEFTLQQRFGNNFDLTPSVNLQYRKVKANINNLNLGNDGFNWHAKLMANYRVVTPEHPLWNNFSFQANGEYESPHVIPQGKRKERYSVDMAMRKDFLKNKKATITFSVDDVFNTRKWGTIYDTESFYQDGYRRWDVRSFRLSFSYRFGDPDFILFKRRNRDSNNNNMEQFNQQGSDDNS